MTVAELISSLQTMPQDKQVTITMFDSENDMFVELGIVSVSLRKNTKGGLYDVEIDCGRFRAGCRPAVNWRLPMNHPVYIRTTLIGEIYLVPDKGWRLNCLPDFARYSTPHWKYYPTAEEAIPGVLRVGFAARIEYD